MLLTSFLSLALGIYMLRKPEVFWKIEHIFTVRDGEPTKFYLALLRIVGFFLIGLSVVIAVIFISMYM